MNVKSGIQKENRGFVRILYYLTIFCYFPPKRCTEWRRTYSYFWFIANVTLSIYNLLSSQLTRGIRANIVGCCGGGGAGSCICTLRGCGCGWEWECGWCGCGCGAWSSDVCSPSSWSSTTPESSSDDSRLLLWSLSCRPAALSAPRPAKSITEDTV